MCRGFCTSLSTVHLQACENYPAEQFESSISQFETSLHFSTSNPLANLESYRPILLRMIFLIALPRFLNCLNMTKPDPLHTKILHTDCENSHSHLSSICQRRFTRWSREARRGYCAGEISPAKYPPLTSRDHRQERLFPTFLLHSNWQTQLGTSAVEKLEGRV